MQVALFPRWLRRDARAWEGAAFSARIIGRGRDVVLVHGLAASRACWEGAAGYLGPDVRLHLLQLNGFAGAPEVPGRVPGQYLKFLADELADYIRQECRRPAAIVGHSMGGVATLILARDHAEVVERAMIVDVPSFFSVLIHPFATASLVSGLAEAARRRYIKRDPSELEADLRNAARRLVRDQDQVERIVAWGMSSDQELTADVMAEVMVTDLRGGLSQIRAPVDVIYAFDRTGAATASSLDRTYASAYAGLASGRLLRIDDARHYVMLDQPRGFYRAMSDWLARRPG